MSKSIPDMIYGLAAAVLMLLVLSSCAVRENIEAAKITGDGDPIKILTAFTVTDLQAASSDAHAHKDVAGYTCWDTLIPLVQQFGNKEPGTQVAGGFSAFQKARNLVQARQGNAVPDSIKMACAQVVLDTQQTIIRLGLIGGGIAITGGAGLPILNGLGNLNQLGSLGALLGGAPK